ncbi:DUF1878 family protein [Exiguobacterium alkaliphilum]|uniref:YhaI family protein n=1 Tax=Exiguobacterium alkaliphilum TaxID=1428684 RepID=A0ABT2KZF2_9BACL|nr:DUF1878 family protein [Exiguobacterium alkaliphilum]MCT4796307.1 YhaI family protein [Exiguobacterium alkaliphilum]
MGNVSLEEKMKQLSYQMELLMQSVDWSDRPFEYEVIRANLTRDDVEAFYALLEEIRQQQTEQGRYGLSSVEPLLVNFVGMLHPALEPETILAACVKQQIALDVTEPLYRQVKLLS